MISLDLARALLHQSGVLWEPSAGDRFVIEAELLSDEVFWVSSLTVEPQHFADQTVLGFNGTTEWALDSVDQEETLWLPSEHQLRALLRGSFRSLERAVSPAAPTDGEPTLDDELDVLLSLGDAEAYTVVVELGGELRRFSAATAPDAYATALLELILRSVA